MKQALILFIVVIANIVVSLQLSLLLLLQPSWIKYEYTKNNFPVDIFELPTNERFEFAKKTLIFISPWNLANTSEPMDIQDKSLYTQKEINHLVDVRTLLQRFLIVSVIVTTALIGIFISKRKDFSTLAKIFNQSGLVTIGIIFFLSLGITFLWEELFETFHRLFFPTGTWQYYETDMLIRLFPPEFWFDSAIALVGLVVAIQVLIILTTRLLLANDSLKG